MNKGSPVWEDRTSAWWREDEGVLCKVPFPRARGSNLLLSSTPTPTPQKPVLWAGCWVMGLCWLGVTARAGMRCGNPRAAE